MKIKMLITSFSPVSGGVYEVVRGLSSALAANHDVHVGTCLAHGTRPMTQVIGRVRLLEFPAYGPPSLGYSPAVGRWLEKEPGDILHVHGLWSYLSVLGSRVSGRRAAPVVISPHGALNPPCYTHHGWRKALALRTFEGRNIRQAACLHALNEAEGLSIRRLGIKNPIAVIAAGVDAPPAVPSKNDEHEGPRRAVFLGRIHQTKGLDALVRAMEIIKRQSAGDLTADWELTIAGWGDEPYVRALRKLIDRSGLHDCIRLVGPCYGDDKIQLLSSAELFILPSKSEGLPIAVLEAWTYGLPVAMTDACNLEEGFAYDAAFRLPNDPAEMARALSAIFLTDRAVLRKVGQRARDLVFRKFRWNQRALQFSELYHWLFGAAPRPASVFID